MATKAMARSRVPGTHVHRSGWSVAAATRRLAKRAGESPQDGGQQRQTAQRNASTVIFRHDDVVSSDIAPRSNATWNAPHTQRSASARARVPGGHGLRAMGLRTA